MREIINSKSSLSEAIGILRRTFEEKKYFTMTLQIGKQRTISQNSITHAWYLQVSREEGEYSPGHVKRLCKLHIGLPILCGDGVVVKWNGEDVDINNVVERIIRPLPYEDKVEAMRFFPVTSLMTTHQLNEYAEGIQRNYAGRVDLQFPEE